MRGGFEVEGAEPGITIVNSTLGDSMRVNRHGIVAANVQLAGPGVTAATDRAIISTLSGRARIVAREGQVIPDTDGFRIYEIRGSAALWSNALGHIVFTAFAYRPSAPTDVRDAILRVDQAGELRPISVSGEIITDRQGSRIRNGLVFYSVSAALADNGTFVYIGNLGPGGDVTGRSIVAVDITPASSTPSCPADFNSDGSATVQDIFDFLSRWFVHDLGADFNNDDTVTVQDLFDFLNVWFGGC
jgi:hypothetical protein